MRMLALTLLALSPAFAQELPSPPETHPGKALRLWSEAAAEGGLSLRLQFVDREARPQGKDMDSCHAFVAVALLEAAVFRQHGTAARFSEADLFMRRTALRNPQRYSILLAEDDPVVDDTGEPLDDLRFALKKGVATGLDYNAFMARYLPYRAAEERELEALAFSSTEEREKWVKQQRKKPARRRAESILSGGADLSASRKESRRLFEGLAPRQKTFKSSKEDDPQQCLEKSAPQREFLVAELKAERPVGVCMRHHCFTLVALLPKAERRFAFGARDSLDVERAPLRDDELCLVYDAVSVLAPVDRRERAD